jgi:hypothetical protein
MWLAAGCPHWWPRPVTPTSPSPSDCWERSGSGTAARALVKNRKPPVLCMCKGSPSVERVGMVQLPASGCCLPLAPCHKTATRTSHAWPLGAAHETPPPCVTDRAAAITQPSHLALLHELLEVFPCPPRRCSSGHVLLVQVVFEGHACHHRAPKISTARTTAAATATTGTPRVTADTVKIQIRRQIVDGVHLFGSWRGSTTDAILYANTRKCASSPVK